MTYLTGSVSGGQNLLNAIVLAMTDNGWTLHDTIAINDKVLYSAGADGYQSMYIRIRNSHTTLSYDGYISGFQVGQTVTGASSGAAATIVGVTEAGSTGTLDIVDRSGFFTDDESITSATGSAVVNRTPTFPDNKNTHEIDNFLNCVYFSIYSYWNSATNTGTNERVRFGPYYIYGCNTSEVPPVGYTTASTGMYMVYRQSDGGTREDAGIEIIKTEDIFFRDGLTSAQDMRGGEITTPFQKVALHDSYRRFVTLAYTNESTNALTYIDIPSRDMQMVKANAGSMATVGYSPGILFQDQSTNTTYRFYYNNIGTTWRMIDIDTGKERIVGTTPFTGTSIGTVGSRLAYDGNRYIYAIVGTPLEFRRFDLQTLTWSSLANPPAVVGGSNSGLEGSMGLGIYIPANTVSGGGLWAEDRILYHLNDVGFLHAYNVSSNSWTTNAITLPVPTASSGFNSLYSDGYNVFYSVGTHSLAYSTPLSQVTGTWNRIYRDARWQYNAAGTNNTSLFAPRVSKVQHSNSLFDYGILVTEDSIVIWTSPNDKFYWAYAGNYNKYGATPFAVALSSHSSGSSLPVQVSSTEGFEIGDTVNVLDITNGISFTAKIEDITADLVISSNFPISSGMWIFITKSDFIITGDTECGSTMYDEIGTSSPTSGNNDILLKDRSSKTQPVYNKSYRIDPVEITWPFDSAGRRCIKGALSGVYSLSGNTEGLSNRATVRDSLGRAYIVFLPQKRVLTKENMIAIGPIA